MQRIDTSNAAVVMPTPEAIGPNPDGYFTEGNPAGGTPATQVKADWLNAVQEELGYLIEQQSITLDKTVHTQLKKAIDFMILKGASAVATASGTDTYAATLTPAITAYTTNILFRIKFTNANTGAATLNLNAIAAKNIKLPNGNDPFAGDIPADHLGLCWYDGTNIVLLNPDQITAKMGRKGTTIASATTTNLATATGDFVDVSGTTTITGLGSATAAGIMRTVRFTGALTLTHNATSLILPGGASITTANGDVAIFRSLGTTGNWVCSSYTKANGQAVVGSAAATQAEQKTGSITTAYTSPGTQLYHLSACKAWVSYNAIGLAINDSYNVTSVTHNATGNFTVNFSITFANSNYAWANGINDVNADNVSQAVWRQSTDTKTTTAIQLSAQDGQNAALRDFSENNIVVFGQI